MSTVRSRLVALGACTMTALFVLATPAGAASVVVANAKYKWFYWAGPLLGLSFLGFVGAFAWGYYVRILRPKWRGRQIP